MAEDEEIGAMMAENLTLKDLNAELNENQAQLKQQLQELTEQLASLRDSANTSGGVRSMIILLHSSILLFL